MASFDGGKSLKIVGFHGTSNGGLKSIGTLKVPTDRVKSVGPYGGLGGLDWNDGKHAGIKQVKVEYDSAIHSITTEYQDNGVSAWSGKHGGLGGKTAMITLDQPNEFLTSISGSYAILNGLLMLMSLMFKSNKRAYGPYGTSGGTNFSSPSGKIVGFFGKSGLLVDSIGAHILVSENEKSVGPYGGLMGFEWDDGKHNDIKKIKVSYAMVIDSIVTEYEDAGISTWSARHGGIGGTSTATIDLQDPTEFLVSVSGYYSTFNNFFGIVSLTFRSNKRTFGPFGPTSGTNFTLSGGKIVGFFGKSGVFLDSIGAHMLVQDPVQSLGAYGGLGGDSWDDGKHTGIKKIELRYWQSIVAITTQYDDNGISQWSAKHGGRGGKLTATIILDYPEEYLVSVSGKYSNVSNLLVLVSLTFQTNKGVFGPYGKNNGTYFSLSSPGGKIVGLWGRSGVNLDSMGVYVTPITSSSYPTYIESFGGQALNLKDGGWNDTLNYDNVRKITVGPSDKGIQYVSFEYVKDGKTVVTQGHGDKPAKLFQTKLQLPNEFLTSITGYYDEVSGNINSLKFKTNKRTIGPYGAEKGTPF